MVIHYANSKRLSGTLCGDPIQLGESATEGSGRVTCKSCLRMFGVGEPSPSAPGGAVPARLRTDADLVDLLARARAAGAREIELRPDGSFRAVLDPAPLAPPAPPPKEPTPAERKAKDDADELHSVEVE